MKLLRRRQPDLVPPGVLGPARVDRRTAALLRRLRPGDVAVLDHLDLDRATADALVARRVAAVVNASASTSGRYPNLGPTVLVDAGVPLLDDVGPDVLHAVEEGRPVRVHGDELYVDEILVATGTAQTPATVEQSRAGARQGLATQLEDFAANTTEYLLQEHDLLLDGDGIPTLRTRFAGRHVVLVVRGYDDAEDLALLRRYLRDHKPLLVGVDDGADALVEAGLRPDLVVGDLTLVRESTLTSGAELVVQQHPDGRAPGLDRARQLGVAPTVFAAGGTSEDLALLLVDEGGASLIVAVGTHTTLLEFLDAGRLRMASTFLTRLRVGGRLVDAQAVAELHRPPVSAWALLALVLAAVLAMGAVLLLGPGGSAYGAVLGDELGELLGWVGQHLPAG